jgi:hypothetical protein
MELDVLDSGGLDRHRIAREHHDARELAGQDAQASSSAVRGETASGASPIDPLPVERARNEEFRLILRDVRSTL